MIYILNLALFLLLIFLSILVDSTLILVIALYSLLLIFLINISNNREYKEISFFVFLFVGIFSLLNSKVYLSLYNNSFGPFYDDSMYYYNSIILSQFKFAIPPTLFEVLLAIPQLISNTIFGVYIPHLYLLPLNWLLSSFTIIILLKIFKTLSFSLNNKQKILFILPIILNYNFIDTSTHFYRDILMIFFIMLFIYNMILDNKKLMLLYGLSVFFLRGANGILLLLLYFIYFFIVKKHYTIKKLLIISFIPLITVFYFSEKIDASLFFRGGFGVSTNENLQDRVINRLSYNQNEGEGGSMILRNGNIFMKSLFPFVYTFSPLLVNNESKTITVIQASETNIYGESVGNFKMPPIIKLPYYFHLLSVAIFIVYILNGLVLSFRINIILKTFAIFMIVQILAISIISMQARHRLPIIFLFPLFFSIAYKKNKMNTLNIILISILFGIIVLGNIVYNL